MKVTVVICVEVCLLVYSVCLHAYYGCVYNHDALCAPDVDECLDSNGGCSSLVCTNTEGSFVCGCNPGYRLRPAMGVNSCEGTPVVK